MRMGNRSTVAFVRTTYYSCYVLRLVNVVMLGNGPYMFIPILYKLVSCVQVPSSVGKVPENKLPPICISTILSLHDEMTLDGIVPVNAVPSNIKYCKSFQFLPKSVKNGPCSDGMSLT